MDWPRPAYRCKPRAPRVAPARTAATSRRTAPPHRTPPMATTRRARRPSTARPQGPSRRAAPRRREASTMTPATRPRRRWTARSGGTPTGRRDARCRSTRSRRPPGWLRFPLRCSCRRSRGSRAAPPTFASSGRGARCCPTNSSMTPTAPRSPGSCFPCSTPTPTPFTCTTATRRRRRRPTIPTACGTRTSSRSITSPTSAILPATGTT